MAEKYYLKNAWAKKDADGSYWLFIEGAAFCSSSTVKVAAATEE